MFLFHKILKIRIKVCLFKIQKIFSLGNIFENKLKIKDNKSTFFFYEELKTLNTLRYFLSF